VEEGKAGETLRNMDSISLVGGLDLFSRPMVGYALTDTLRPDFVVYVLGGTFYATRYRFSRPFAHNTDTPGITGTMTGGVLSETASASYTFSGTLGSTPTFTMPLSGSDLTGAAAG
jgi:hypothetical protein